MGATSYFNLYWMKIWHVNSSVASFTLSKSYMKTEQFLGLSLTVKSSLYSQLNLTTKQRKNSLVCGFDAAFLPNVFQVFEKLWAVFNAEKKLFNPAQVALAKTPRKEAKIYQKTDFLCSEGHLLTSPGCCLTLASLLSTQQERQQKLKSEDWWKRLSKRTQKNLPKTKKWWT